MNVEQVGKIIKKKRIECNLTQKEFADKLGVTYQAVSKWENGKNMPDIVLLKEICSILNIDINELFDCKKKNNNNLKILIVGVLCLVIIAIIFINVIIKNNSNFYFKTISSNCDEFTLTGSAAYNNSKTSIYISDVDYCGVEDNTLYKSFECSLYEDYRNTKTKIGSCGSSNDKKYLDEFLETVQINVNNYNASCKLFSSSLLYMEIKAVNLDDKITSYQIPINLNDNCNE